MIPYVEGRLLQLTNFIESNVRATDFGFQIDEIITNNGFQPSEFYPIFQNAFAKAYLKFSVHIPSHPGRPLFYACQIFNPKFIHAGGVNQRNLRHYEIISELNNPSDTLLNEWTIHCNIEDDIDAISSCSVERSFSKYNSILDSDRQSLSETSLQSLNMLYFNGKLANKFSIILQKKKNLIAECIYF